MKPLLDLSVEINTEGVTTPRLNLSLDINAEGVTKPRLDLYLELKYRSSHTTVEAVRPEPDLNRSRRVT